MAEPQDHASENDPARPSLWRRMVGGIVTFGLALAIRYVGRKLVRPAGPLPEPPPTPPGGLTIEPASPEEEIHYPDGRMEHPAIRYESRDVRFGWILALLLLACGIAATHYYAVVLFYRWQARAQASQKSTPYPTVTEPRWQLPPQPRLEQVDRLENMPVSDLYLLEAPRERELHRYGPTEEKAFVRIPIEQAIHAVAADLPTAKTPPAERAKSGGLLDSGESNSGRVYREGPR